MSSLSEDQIALPEQIKKPEGALTFWCIYDHPLDQPDGYVLRAQFALRGRTLVSPIAWRASDPDQLRSILPPGVTCMGPDPENKTILEVWME